MIFVRKNEPEVSVELSHEDLDIIANKVDQIPRHKRTLAKIFSTALFKKPTLIFDALKVFADCSAAHPPLQFIAIGILSFFKSSNFQSISKKFSNLQKREKYML